MNIAIVGAGLGGLAAATCLAQAGHTVTVFEKRSGSSPQGGIIALRPSALKVLYGHGLEDQISDISLPLGETHFRMLHDGKVLRTMDLHEDQVAGEGLSLVTTRGRLEGVLREGARRSGAKVVFGKAVKDFEEDGTGTTLHFDDGSTHEADLALVADGIRSKLRGKVLADQGSSSHEPIITNTTIYAATLPASLLPPDVKARWFESSGPWVRMSAWNGKDSWAMSAFNHVHDTIDIGVAIVEPTSQTSLWDEEGDVEYLREYFKDRAYGDILAALEVADRMDRWRLAYMPELPRWSSQGGRVALLGDAAHAILPNGGAGITLTIEDVGALTHLLSKYDDIPKVLRIWQDACKPRADKLREFGCFNMRRLEGDKEAHAATERALKEEAMVERGAVRPDGEAQWSTLAFARWLSGYDPVVEAEECMRREEREAVGN